MGKPDRKCCLSDAKMNARGRTETEVEGVARRTQNKRIISKKKRNEYRKMFKLRHQEVEEAPIYDFRGSLTSIPEEMEAI